MNLMRHTVILVFGLASLASPRSARSADLIVTGRISAVTVYADRVLVTRSAKANLSAGENNVVFPTLPAGLFDDSVTAAIRSGTGQIQGIEIQRKYVGSAQDEKIRALEKEIEQLGDKQQELNNRAEIERKQLEFGDKLQVYQIDKASKELAIKETKVEEWDSVLKFLEKMRSERLAAMQKVAVEHRELARSLAIKQAELNQIKGARAAEACAVTVHLMAKQAGESTIEARYVISGAGWQPLYEVRATAGSSDLELGFLGTVSQRTGEEWKDVEVALSTARPSVGAHLDDLTPQYLEASWFRPVGSFSMRSSDAVGSVGGIALPSPAPASPAPGGEGKDEMVALPAGHGWETAQQEVSGTSALYKVPRVQTIPSGERPQRVTVSLDRFKASMVYVTRPKIQPFAYLKATVKNESDNHFVAGPINVFLGGDFIGQSRIESIAPKQEFPVFLGIDERVKVKREQLIDKRKQSFWGKKLVLASAFRITVENYTGAMQTIWIGDQKPVSKDSSIVVRNFKADVEPTSIKEEKGEIEWRVELKSGEKRAIEFGYEVVFPEDVSMQPAGREKIEEFQRSL